MTTKTTEEIIAEIPALKLYAGQEDTIHQLYAQLHPKKDLSDLVEGEWVNGADVLVVRVIGTSSYVGCPVCYSKKEGIDVDTSFNCTNNRCNTQRVATKLVKWTLLGGDPTTKVILDFPPFGFKLEDGNALIAKVVNVKGKVTDMREQKVNGEVKGTTPVIQVREMKIVSDIRDAPVETLDVTITKSTLAEAAQVPVNRTLTTADAMPTPPNQPVSTLPEAKLKVFRTWMTVMSATTGSVAEPALKAYVTNNLKATMEDVAPLLDKHFQDSTQQNVYTLRPEPQR